MPCRFWLHTDKYSWTCWEIGEHHLRFACSPKYLCVDWGTRECLFSFWQKHISVHLLQSLYLPYASPYMRRGSYVSVGICICRHNLFILSVVKREVPFGFDVSHWCHPLNHEDAKAFFSLHFTIVVSFSIFFLIHPVATEYRHPHICTECIGLWQILTKTLLQTRES